MQQEAATIYQCKQLQHLAQESINKARARPWQSRLNMTSSEIQSTEEAVLVQLYNKRVLVYSRSAPQELRMICKCSPIHRHFNGHDRRTVDDKTR